MGCASAFLVIFWTAIIDNFVEEEPITYNYFKNAGTGEKYYFKTNRLMAIIVTDQCYMENMRQHEMSAILQQES